MTSLNICRTPHPQNRRVGVFHGWLRPRRLHWADARIVAVSAFFAVFLQAVCALAIINGVSHPSDIDVRSTSRDSRPKTLPLQNDRITCNTCHLHDRQKPADHKLVRLVHIKPTGVDWIALCRDCHEDY